MFDGTADTPQGIIPSQDKEATIRIYQGWNLVGQPFIKAVKWDVSAIKVSALGQKKSLRDAADWVAGYAWGWNAAAEEYYLVCDQSIVPDATGSLAPWQAYWIKASRECDLILPAP
jgi:hypothetical protein